MDVIVWYAIFAITTGLVANYELIAPVFADLALIEPEHNMLEYKWISYIVFTLIDTVAAPVVILSCIIPSVGERFRNALLTALTNP